MREILFRGKREDNGEWIFGYPIYDFADCTAKRKGKCVCNHNGELIGFIAWKDQEHEYDNVQVDPSTVGQYTGLTDKNGRKIFEGDIINYKGALAKVIYSTENAGFYALFSSWDTDLRALSAGKYVSVIGNIYDNPER